MLSHLTPRRDVDHDLPSRSALLDQGNGFGGPLQRVVGVDDGLDIARLDQVAQLLESRSVRLRDKRGDPLLDDQVEQGAGSDTANRSEPPAAIAVGLDQRSARGEHPTQGARAVGAAELEDQIVVRGSCGRILRGVVDHLVRAEAPDQLEPDSAAHTGDLGSSVFGKLYRERPDASGCADDQNVLSPCQTAATEAL